ncbi:MAG: M23 family metallopeptidase [Chloroflexi bacterium]|nr:M23 family metallopeptidase [Chloroflexota bacterium]
MIATSNLTSPRMVHTIQVISISQLCTRREVTTRLVQYIHLRQGGVAVSVGQFVQRGQLVGYSGNSGYSCGAHLHFHVNRTYGGPRIWVAFEDTGNAVPLAGRYHLSGNYIGSLLQQEDMYANPLDVQPDGMVQFRLNTEPTSNEVKLWAFDYLAEVEDFRVAESEVGLQDAAWMPYTNTISWSGSTIFVEYQTTVTTEFRPCIQAHVHQLLMILLANFER